MPMVNRITSAIMTALATTILFSITFISAQVNDITAEAILEANLRATTDVSSNLVGSIQNGTRYPIIGRSEFYPWVLVGDPETGLPLGWVFQDLVTISGDLNRVPFSTLVVDNNPSSTEIPSLPTPTTSAQAPPPTPETAGGDSEPPLVGVAVGAVATAISTATANIPSSGVTGQVAGEINVRFGPGVEYPRIGVAREGELYEITAYHTQFPWVQVRFSEVAGGFGWIAIDLLEIQGNIYLLPAISRTTFSLPTLTPTPNAVNAVTGLPNFDSAPISGDFQALGERLWQKLLDNGFEPETSRFGSLFLMDLQTGEAITFGDGIAYSGMSLSKINILTSWYRALDRLPDGVEARQMANMMICSENTSSNEILTYIGGDPYSGATTVTNTLRELGLQNTFMVAPFLIDPRITPQPVTAPTTNADQARANPDPFNQMTVTEVGWMLNSVYQCAVNDAGPLRTTFSNGFNQRECQQMLDIMSGNKIGALIEVGVPEDVRVAHKHGWIDDTHGDAGIVFTPGGDYVLVVVLHNPVWLNFEESFPLIEDISLTVYNYFNPDTPMPATRQSNVPATCDLSTAEGITLIDNLVRGETGQ